MGSTAIAIWVFLAAMPAYRHIQTAPIEWGLPVSEATAEPFTPSPDACGLTVAFPVQDENGVRWK
jgi:hypothetical protein